MTLKHTSLALASALALFAAAGAAAAVDARMPAAANAPPAISVVGWDPARRAASVWRGLAVLSETRTLPGARLPVLARSTGVVAFVRPVADGFEVYATGTQNDTERRLARVAGRRPLSIAISPDARLVAFPSARGLETVSAQGVRRLLPIPAGWRASFFDALAFSPDGSLLGFSRTWRDAHGALRNELGVVRRDGTGGRSLVANRRPLEGRLRPTFTPDGGQIVFTAPDRSLAIVPTAGGRARSLTAPPARHGGWTDVDPVFSADGAWVAFTRRRSGIEGGGSDAYVVRVSGRDLRRVTTTPVPPDPDLPAVGTVALAWSPDGTRLLVKRHDRLAVAEVATGASTELLHVGYGYAVTTAYWNP